MDFGQYPPGCRLRRPPNFARRALPSAGRASTLMPGSAARASACPPSGVESKVPHTKEECMAMQPALGDVSCDLPDVETPNLTEAWLEVLARTYTFGFAVRAAPASGETFSARTSRWQLGSLALVHTVHDRGDGRR